MPIRFHALLAFVRSCLVHVCMCVFLISFAEFIYAVACMAQTLQIKRYGFARCLCISCRIPNIYHSIQQCMFCRFTFNQRTFPTGSRSLKPNILGFVIDSFGFTFFSAITLPFVVFYFLHIYTLSFSNCQTKMWLLLLLLLLLLFGICGKCLVQLKTNHTVRRQMD